MKSQLDMYVSEMKDKYVWPIIDDEVTFSYLSNINFLMIYYIKIKILTKIHPNVKD